MENYLKLITENPHRMMGVYANSSVKAIMSNKSKALAFIKVGKDIAFPADLSCIMTPMPRSLAHVNDACCQVLSENRLRYAQFWFMQMDATDTEALNQLSLGDLDVALRIWSEQETMSSLQNRMICYFLQEDLPSAFSTAETLYEKYGQAFIQQIDMPGSSQMSTSELSHLFLETLGAEVDLASLYDCCQSDEWKEIVTSIVVQSATSELSYEIEQYRNVNHTDPVTLKKAGENLMERSKKPLNNLQKVLSKESTQYQMLADKVGEEILNCCIEYVNLAQSDIYDSVHSIYKLLIYAKNTIVGMVAKRRFEQNYDMIKPLLSISKEDYKRAMRRPYMKKIRWGVILSIMITVGIIVAFMEKELSGFWMGLAMSVPLCVLTNRVMLLFE
ncbi:MAG: hypothetical protein IKZ52_00985 [Bacteroidales bacterium]|nr:hypothetical protein [Bacteroidales bacterium]